MTRGRYRASCAVSGRAVSQAQAFRARLFGLTAATDADAYDARCVHVSISDTTNEALVCCFRLLPLCAGEITQSYSAQFYDLRVLEGYPDPVLEVGRFCMDPACSDPDVLRLAWAVMTGQVEAQGAGMLFGCSSFVGTAPVAYGDAFAMLAARHSAPQRWRPGRKAAETVALNATGAHSRKEAIAQTPPLLRSYLGLGAWVSDHAVIDRHMDTIHVFTALEVGLIPPARHRALRQLLGP